MNVLLAFAHISGALITLGVLSMVGSSLSARREERTKKDVFEHAAMSLGIRAEEVKQPENWPQVLQRIAERFSSDKFQNRLSDVCGSVLTPLDWCFVVSSLLLLVFVVWQSFSEGPSAAINAWWAPVIFIAGWLTDVVVSSVCWLLTGRSPGRASAVRQFVAREMGSGVETNPPRSG